MNIQFRQSQKVNVTFTFNSDNHKKVNVTFTFNPDNHKKVNMSKYIHSLFIKYIH